MIFSKKTSPGAKAAPAPGSAREAIGVALPMVVSFACDTVMIFTDRVFLSRLGPDMMNAALGGGISFYMMLTFVMGLTGYSTALVAQYLGAGQKEYCARAAAQAMIVAIAAYPVLILCRPFSNFLFDIMGVPAEQLGPQIRYYNALMWGCVFALLRHCFASFYSGLGQTRIVMIASLTALIVNVIAGYTLIFGHFGFPALGIEGAAIGMTFASFCALAVMAWQYFGARFRQEFGTVKALVFDLDVMKKLLVFGYPAGLEMFLNILAFNGLVMTFHSMGVVVATATTVVLNWDMVTYVPLMGIEIAATSLMGRYMGAGRPDIAHKATMSSFKIGCCYAFVMMLMFVFFSRPLVTVFEPAVFDAHFAEAQPMAVFMLRLISIYVFSEVMLVVFIGALRGAGDTLWAMMYTVSVHWIIVGVLFTLLRVFDQPATTAWLTMIGIFLVLSTAVVIRYRQGKWKSIRVVGPGV